MGMDNNFQDRIDEYLLHGDTMSEEAKAQFLKEIEEDTEKKEQYEFTKNVKKALKSRGEKLKAMTEFQREMKHGHRRTWLWISSVAAILVVGFFAIKPQLVDNSSIHNVRGGENDVFSPTHNVRGDENDVFKTTAPPRNEGCKSSPKFKTPNDTTNIDTIAKYK